MHLAQELAARAVAAVVAGRSLTETLSATWRQNATLSIGDRGAVQDLSYGTLRHLGRLRSLVAELAPRAPEKPLLCALLWVALYQLAHTRNAAHAVVDHAVRAAIHLDAAEAKGFVNALLRRYLRETAALELQASRTDEGNLSYPKWWIDLARAEYPADWRTLLEAGNQRPPMTLRVNLRRCALSEYQNQLLGVGLTARPLGPAALSLERGVAVTRLPGFAEGRVSVQDAGAQWAAPLLDLCDGQRVLDACAAPGGKTAHMLEAAQIDLTAIDSDAMRLPRVQENLRRLGLNARLLCADATQLQSWWDGVAFDRILADVPCSASGVVRRHPDIKWLRRPQDLPALLRQQQSLLDTLWKVLAPGGKLLYVTCSIFRQENDQQVTTFISRRQDARRIALASFPNAHGQLLPCAEHDGFYYALLRKND